MERAGRDRPDVTVRDPPTPTLPEVIKLEALMAVVDIPPFKTPSPVTVKDAPIPTLPVDDTVKAEDPPNPVPTGRCEKAPISILSPISK